MPIYVYIGNLIEWTHFGLGYEYYKIYLATNGLIWYFSFYLSRIVIAMGILQGSIVGALWIIPVSLYGFFTLPITLPITIWKTIDECNA